MLIAALSLALGVVSPTLPVTSLATEAAIAVCFAPEENCTALAVDAIDHAETQILVSVYGLTTSSNAVEALIQARRRGVFESSRAEPRHANAKRALPRWPRQECRSG